MGATFVGDTSLPHLQGRTSLSRSDPLPGLVRSRQTVARLSQARDLPKRVMQIRINRPRRPGRRRCHRHADSRSVLGCGTSLIDLSLGFGRDFFFGPLGSRLVHPTVAPAQRSEPHFDSCDQCHRLKRGGQVRCPCGGGWYPEPRVDLAPLPPVAGPFSMATAASRYRMHGSFAYAWRNGRPARRASNSGPSSSSSSKSSSRH